jgi:penicillin-binding protein 1A
LRALFPRARHAGKPPRRTGRLSLLRLFLLISIYGLFAAAAIAYYVVTEVARELPDDLSAALDYQPDRASRVYSADGELIGEFFLQKRILVAPEHIPDHVRNAFIAAEDRRFWEHPGFDLLGILRAAHANYRSGETRQGASTITQQVTRMLLLTNERTYERKLKEVILSMRVERELSKAQILHTYLNHVYLGQGAYGVEAGAEVYFGKSVGHLTVAEAALLAGLVQAPSRYAPTHNIQAAHQRQRYVLDRMHADGYVTDAGHAQALAEPLALIGNDRPLNHVAAPYFVEHVRQWATRRFDPGSVLHGGLHIYTTLDTRLQNAAETAVRTGLVSLDRRIGFRGPIGHLDDSALDTLSGGVPRPYTGSLADLVRSSNQTLLPDVVYIGAIERLSGTSAVTVAMGPLSLPMEQSSARQVRAWRSHDDARPGGVRAGDLVPVSVLFGPDGPSAVQLAQAPDVQGALVAMEPDTGRVVAMVGGYDYAQSQFNRAIQARRQIGSAIKPFIYALALEGGMTHLDPVEDKPVTVHTASGEWSPANYDRRYHGVVTLRTVSASSPGASWDESPKRMTTARST